MHWNSNLTQKSPFIFCQQHGSLQVVPIVSRLNVAVAERKKSWIHALYEGCLHGMQNLHQTYYKVETSIAMDGAEHCCQGHACLAMVLDARINVESSGSIR